MESVRHPNEASQDNNFNSDFEKTELIKPTIGRTFSGAPWEKKVGYCRAIRMGNTIAVTGTTSITDDGKVFADHPPATTMVEIKALIDPSMLVEIEADAVVLQP